MTDAINWFEIPVRDLDRATRFYESLLGKKLKREIFGGMPMATFPTGAMEDVGGSLVADPKRAPSMSGSLVYLDAPDLDDALVRAAKAGGQIEVPKRDIGDPGHIAIIIDTEGNRIGLHAHRS